MVLTIQGDKSGLENNILNSPRNNSNPSVQRGLALGQHKPMGYVVSASGEQDMTNMHPPTYPRELPITWEQGSFTPIAARETLPQHSQLAELTWP